MVREKDYNYFLTEAFTLIELMVVVSIFMLVFVFSYEGLKNNRRLEEFRLTTERVASEIRKVQTMALAGISANDLGNISYGAYFDEATPLEFKIFKDSNESKNFEDSDEVILTITLPENISLADVGPDPLTALAIVFSPPKPTMYFNGQELLTDITINLIRSNLTNKTGLIEVNRITGRVTAKLIDN